MTWHQHMQRKQARIRHEQEDATLALMLTPSGITTAGAHPDTSSAFIPEPSRLRIREDQTLGLVEIVTTDEGVTVAGAHIDEEHDLATLRRAAQGWLRSYTRGGRPQLLDIKDPSHLSPAEFAAMLANPQGKPGSSYRKLTMASTPAAPSVAVGQGKGGKRYTWNGHSAFSVLKYLGQLGATNQEGSRVASALQIPMSKGTVMGGLYAGRQKDGRGQTADLTPTQASELQAILSNVRTDILKVDPSVVLPAPVAAVGKPSITTEQGGRGGNKRLTKQQKQLAHDQKIMAEVKKRRSAGKH